MIKYYIEAGPTPQGIYFSMEPILFYCATAGGFGVLTSLVSVGMTASNRVTWVQVAVLDAVDAIVFATAATVCCDLCFFSMLLANARQAFAFYADPNADLMRCIAYLYPPDFRMYHHCQRFERQCPAVIALLFGSFAVAVTLLVLAFKERKQRKQRDDTAAEERTERLDLEAEKTEEERRFKESRPLPELPSTT